MSQRSDIELQAVVAVAHAIPVATRMAIPLPALHGTTNLNPSRGCVDQKRDQLEGDAKHAEPALTLA
jgi:hypothetical protein